MVKEVLSIHRVDMNLNEMKHQFADQNIDVKKADFYYHAVFQLKSVKLLMVTAKPIEEVAGLETNTK